MNPMYDAMPSTQVQSQYPSMPQAQSYGMVDSPAIAREVATVQSQIVIAKRFPRDEQTSIRKIEQACSREKLANSAVYAYAKGGTNVSGASIRLAEAVATAWGNIKYGFEETDNADGVSTVRSYAYDMESNTQAERIYKVPHIRHTRNGDYSIEDPREIYELVANQSARRVRACILEVVPSDVVEYAMEVCEKTRTANVDINPVTLENLCNAFASFGVTKVQIEGFIQRNLNAITTTQYLKLRDIYASIKDGMSGVKDWFRSEAELAKESKKEEAQQQSTTVESVQETVTKATDNAQEKAEENLSFNF